MQQQWQGTVMLPVIEKFMGLYMPWSILRAAYIQGDSAVLVTLL
jgi:hypothetical protein